MTASAGAATGDRRHLALLALGNLVLLAWIAHHPVEITSDTPSYLTHEVTRTPLYPWFLDLCRLVGGSHFLRVAEVLQVALGLAAASLAAATLIRRARVGVAWFVVVWALLVVPLARFGQVIGTEPLSWGLLLVLVHFLVELFFSRARQALFGVFGTLALLLMLRPQFLFVVPVAALLAPWSIVCARDRRGAVLVLGLLGLAWGGATVAQCGYNWLHNGRFMKIPFTGFQLLDVAIYPTGPDEIARFSAPDEVDYLTRLYRRLDEERMIERRAPGDYEMQQHFAATYNPRIHVLIDEYQALKHLPPGDIRPDEMAAFDRLTQHIAIALWKHHPAQLVVFRLKELRDREGYLPLVMLLALALGAIGYQRRREPLFLVVVFAVLLGFANDALVLLVEPLGTRYAIYTDALQVPIWLVTVAALYARAVPDAEAA